MIGPQVNPTSPLEPSPAPLEVPTSPGGRCAPSVRGLLTWGITVCLLLAAVASSIASRHPDGLEYVTGQLGLQPVTSSVNTEGSPLAGYAVTGVDGALSGGLAGVAGVLAVAAVAAVLVWMLRRSRSRTRP